MSSAGQNPPWLWCELHLSHKGDLPASPQTIAILATTAKGARPTAAVHSSSHIELYQATGLQEALASETGLSRQDQSFITEHLCTEIIQLVTTGKGGSATSEFVICPGVCSEMSLTVQEALSA